MLEEVALPGGVTEPSVVRGISTAAGDTILAGRVVITTGTSQARASGVGVG